MSQADAQICKMAEDVELASNPTQKKKKRPHKILTDDQVAAKKKKLENDNTVKQEKTAEQAFISFLEASECENTSFWLYPVKDLDNYLGKFFLGVQKAEGQKYKLNSLQTLRYALNRLLKKRGLLMDITKDAAFSNSQKCYAAACLELKEEGLGVVDSTPEINEDGKYIISDKISC